MAIDSTQYLTDRKAELASLQLKIEKAEDQQEYSIDDGQAKQTVKRGELKAMYARKENLEAQILAIETGGSRPFQARPL